MTRTGQAMYRLKECELALQQRVRPGNNPSHDLFYNPQLYKKHPSVYHLKLPQGVCGYVHAISRLVIHAYSMIQRYIIHT